MSQCEQELCAGEVRLRLPVHSVLLWDMIVDGVVSEVSLDLLRNVPVRVRSPGKLHVWPGRFHCGSPEKDV